MGLDAIYNCICAHVDAYNYTSFGILIKYNISQKYFEMDVGNPLDFKFVYIYLKSKDIVSIIVCFVRMFHNNIEHMYFDSVNKLKFSVIFLVVY